MIGILGAFSHFALADNASNSSLESSSEQNASAANNGNALAEHLSSNKAVTPNPLLIDETSSLSTSDANSVDEKPLNKRADKRRRKKNKLLLDRSRRLEINSLKTLTPTTPPLITAAAAGGSTAQPASATAPLTTAAAGSSTGQPASNPTDAFERGPGELNAREPALALNVSNHNDGATATPAALAQHRNRVEALAPFDASSINSMFSQDPETDVISVGQNVEGNTLSVSGAHGDRIITGVAEGVSNNDVANVAQLKQVRSTATSAQALAQKNTSRIKEIENKLAKTNTKIDRGLASSAALTGLFQPYGVGKVNLTAGLGGYGSSQAIAIGSGYRINENTAFKAGVAYSDGNSVMYNASFNLEW